MLEYDYVLMSSTRLGPCRCYYAGYCARVSSIIENNEMAIQILNTNHFICTDCFAVFANSLYEDIINVSRAVVMAGAVEISEDMIYLLGKNDLIIEDDK
jgi:hypothetical protein